MLKSKIDSLFIKHDKDRITLGDILQDVTFHTVDCNNNVIKFFYEYLIIITQDCDLEQWYRCKDKTDKEEKNQFLANILILPAFIATKVKEGSAYDKLFNIHQRVIPTKEYEQIKQNKNDRYHFLKGQDDIKLQDLIVDFKHYLTIPYDVLVAQYKESYLATINELFRENLSCRFANYLSRIALPEI